MRKNAAGQTIGAQLLTTAGAAYTGACNVFVTLDGGTQGAGGGVVTDEGNGYFSYALLQAETNATLVAVTFVPGGSGVPQTVQAYTDLYTLIETTVALQATSLAILALCNSILAAVNALSGGGGGPGIGTSASSIYSAQRLSFDPLHEDEIRVLEFPFGGALLLGETIASATITVTVYSGTDGTPQLLKSGSLTISGTSVLQNFSGNGGELGVTYNLVCVATTSAGRQLQARGFLALIPQS